MLRLVSSKGGEPPADLIVVSHPLPGVVHLALNQPQQRNALTEQLALALRREVARVAETDSARALIVTGNGSAFCAGADLGALGAEATTPAAKREVLVDYYRAFLDLRELRLPTIAAVNGAAIGAGLNLALCCDLRIVADDARLAAPFVRLGIHPGGGATWMLTRLVGPAAAKEMLLLGRPIDAQRAYQIGLANRVVPAPALQGEALEWAAALAALPRPVLRNLKRTLELAQSGAPLEGVIDVESAAQADALASEDAREGWAAFRDHRAPEFRDR